LQKLKSAFRIEHIYQFINPPFFISITVIIYFLNYLILYLLALGAGHVARMGRRGMHVGYWWEIHKERDHWEDQDLGGWTILK
jgi:hypothetical protein